MKVTRARIPLVQAGSGVSSVFYGSPYQKGHGLGSILGGLFRTIMPFVKSGARAVGKQALSTGGDIFRDVVKGKPFSDSAKDHLIKAGHSLANQAKLKLDKIQHGKGLKAVAVKRKRHNVVVAPRKRTCFQKRKDIFT